VPLVGHASHGDYGLPAPRLAWVISRPPLSGTSQRARRCPCRTYRAAVGALATPWPGVPGVELATSDVRPWRLPLSRTPPRLRGRCRTFPRGLRRSPPPQPSSQGGLGLSGVSASAMPLHPSRSRDVRLLAVWRCLTTRPCPHHACSPAHHAGRSAWHRVGQDRAALPALTSFACIATRPSAAPKYFHLISLIAT
jgi:hypothetical protein